MDPKEKRLADCQRVIGYYFADPTLLETALTHSSLRSPDRECNERLEFLGDSVLGLVITEELYHLLPDSAEGEMTRIKSAVVSRKSLYRASTQLGLADYAEYARGVGKRDELPTSVVANLVESVIGAIYLDAGYYPAREFVLRHLGDEIEDVLNDRGAKNYKSLLQHEVQQSTGVTPHYRTVEEEGPDHDKVFIVATVIQGKEWGRSKGANKKEAEQDAARLGLEAWSRRGRGRRRRKADREADEVAKASRKRRKSKASQESAKSEKPKRKKRASKAKANDEKPAKAKDEKPAKAEKKSKSAPKPTKKKAEDKPKKRAKKKAKKQAAEAEATTARPKLKASREAPEGRIKAKAAAKRPARKRRKAKDDEPVAEKKPAKVEPAPVEAPEAEAAKPKRPARKRRAKKPEPAAAKEQPAKPVDEAPAEPVAEKPEPAPEKPAAKKPKPKKAPADFGAGILEGAELDGASSPRRNTSLVAKPEKATRKIKGRVKAPSQSKPKDDDGFAI